jgi:hypothetical protein
VLQPHSAFVALALRTTNDALKEARDQGFNEVLFKPFQAENIEEFLAQWFDNQELVTAEENVLHVTGFNGRPERLDRYFTRLSDLIPSLLDKVAAACHEHVVVDMAKAPVQGDKLPKLLLHVASRARDIGIGVSVVGSPEVQKLLAAFEETSAIKCFASVKDAHAASA